MQKISKESGVMIEPESQTVLLDKLMQDPEICYACVPGAGGDDAFVCLRKSKCGLEANLRS